MRRFSILVAAIALFTTSGCVQPVPEIAALDDESGNELFVAAPVRHANLTIFPVCSRTPRDEDRFLTLDEGLKAGTVEVREVGSEPSAQETPGSPEIRADLPEFPANVDANVPQGPWDPDRSDEPPGVWVDVPWPTDPTGKTHAGSPANRSVPNRPFGCGIDDARSGIIDEGNVAEIDARVIEIIANNAETPRHFDRLMSPTSASVNRLVVINRSDRPLYLMPGEIVVGGKQDRTIGQEIVIAPGGKPTPIDAFCVERGRWRPRTPIEIAAIVTPRGPAESDIAAYELDLSRPLPAPLIITEALTGHDSRETVDPRNIGKYGPDGPAGGPPSSDQPQKSENESRFIGSAGTLDSKGRFAVVGARRQADVWEKVAATNNSSGNTLLSGSEGFIGNYLDPTVVGRFEPYVKELIDKVTSQDNVVGVVVAVDGKITTADVFESTPLFKKLWPKLLKSYALDAANSAKGVNSKQVESKTVVSVPDAEEFLSAATTAETTETQTKDGLTLTKREGKHCVSFSASDAASSSSNGRYREPSSVNINAAGDIHTSAFGK